MCSIGLPTTSSLSFALLSPHPRLSGNVVVRCGMARETTMVRVAMLRPLLGMGLAWLLLLRLPGTHASGPGRRLSHPDPLPPCSQVPDGVSGWDCHDLPNHPLQPCDFHHQRVGVDCSGWRPVVSRVGSGAATPTIAFESKTRPVLERHIAIDLPPCSRSSDDGRTPDSWKCFDAPTSRPLLPEVESDHVGEESPAATAAGGSETKTATTTQEKGTGRVHGEVELPPCSGLPFGIPGRNCYDRPRHSLPPCDFQHQRIGFDCSGWPPRRLLLEHQWT